MGAHVVHIQPTSKAFPTDIGQFQNPTKELKYTELHDTRVAITDMQLKSQTLKPDYCVNLGLKVAKLD